MKLASIHLFPVKSLRGISVGQVQIGKFGPVGDRRWMLVDDNGRFVTQRKHPALSLVQTALVGDGKIELRFPSGDVLCLDPGECSGAEKVRIWNDEPEVMCGPASASAVFSDYLGMACRLVYMPYPGGRQVDRAFFPEDKKVAFADGFPVLLLTTGSLGDLNDRLQNPVAMARFRPNLVVECDQPYAEDSWKEIRIGEVCFRVVKPCSRCVMTTIDPETGVPDRLQEPLRTLAAYRKNSFGVCFGQNLIHLNEGCLRVGDVLDIIR